MTFIEKYNKINYRNEKISKEIYKNIAFICNNKIKNFSNNFITINSVTLSSDYSYAKIFITLLNKKTLIENKKYIKYIQNQSKYIRFLLSKKIKLRIVPKLIFYYDNSLINGIKICKFLNKK